MINIYTIQFSDPEFLELQLKTFNKFLKADHCLICINNVNGVEKPDLAFRMSVKAEQLGITRLFPHDTNHSQAGHSHQSALNWVWKNCIANNNDDISIIVDHDMFPIRPFTPDLDYDITGIMQGRGDHIKYFHPGLMIINNTLKDKETVDFRGQYIDGIACDTGGNWHHYLAAHPDLKIKAMNMVNISAEHENLSILPFAFDAGAPYDEADPFQICEDFMLHFRNGSNWAWTKPEDYQRKMHYLRVTLNHYMELENGK